MKFIRLSLTVVLAVLLAGTLTAGAGPDRERDQLFQVATLSALQEGVYDGALTMKELGRHGDFGIGTFEGLDGEMIELDGQFYQIKADGKVYPVDGEVKTPFATVTYFEADRSVTLKTPLNYQQLQAYIQTLLPTQNIPYAIKICGKFQSVKTRSVPRQTKPYPRLIEVTKNQPTFELGKVSGTILGFWLPPYLAGVNLAGYHFHFLTDDRRAGGHLLECQLVAGTVEVDYTYGLNLALPDQSNFFKTDLTKGTQKELEKIEQ
jgi:acetolactate decarboxylase